MEIKGLSHVNEIQVVILKCETSEILEIATLSISPFHYVMISHGFDLDYATFAVRMSQILTGVGVILTFPS